jgi:hypothetical protein
MITIRPTLFLEEQGEAKKVVVVIKIRAVEIQNF